MFEFLARSILTVTLGVLFLLWMLLALASETLSEVSARRRMTTQFRRNHDRAPQSYRLTVEEAQS